MTTTAHHLPVAAAARAGTRALATLGLCAALTPSAHALFEDGEARRAILELRQRTEASAQENTQLRRSLLDLQAQIEAMRGEIALLRGQNEQLARETAELQRRQTDLAQGIDERMRRVEPVTVQLDGLEFTASPQEKHSFEAALDTFRSGDFAAARTAFAAFVNAHPGSGYLPSARFWLANTQYAGRDHKEAIANFRSMLRTAPQHTRAADAMLTLADSLAELKDTKAARKTLQDLIAAHPGTEAAQAAQARLQRLK